MEKEYDLCYPSPLLLDTYTNDKHCELIFNSLAETEYLHQIYDWQWFSVYQILENNIL